MSASKLRPGTCGLSSGPAPTIPGSVTTRCGAATDGESTTAAGSTGGRTMTLVTPPPWTVIARGWADGAGTTAGSAPAALLSAGATASTALCAKTCSAGPSTNDAPSSTARASCLDRISFNMIYLLATGSPVTYISIAP